MKIQKNDISKEIKITMIEVKNTSTINPKILVIGIGGGGNNAVNRMVNSNTCSDSLEYVAINTDQMVLNNSQAAQTLTIGPNLPAASVPAAIRRSAVLPLKKVKMLLNRSSAGATWLF